MGQRRNSLTLVGLYDGTPLLTPVAASGGVLPVPADGTVPDDGLSRSGGPTLKPEELESVTLGADPAFVDGVHIRAW